MVRRDDHEVAVSSRSRWRKALRGAAAGLVGGLAMTLVMLVLRWTAGVPLPVEVVSDRVIPLLSVRTFVRLLGRIGGPLRGKELAYLSSFAGQLIAAVGGGALYGTMGRRGWRQVVAAAALSIVWVGFVLTLWPALASNYRGLGPGSARIASVVAFGLALATYGCVVVLAIRSRGAPVEAASPSRPAAMDRRRFLFGIGSGALLALASAGLAGLLYRRATFGAFGYDGMQLRGPRTSPITPNDRFYVVTKNLVDPTISESLWRLEVGGMVDRPRSFSLDELTALSAARQEQTLECISNRVGAGLMSNAVWTGVRLHDLIRPAGPHAGATRVLLHAADGYTHAISVARAMEPTTLLAYRMNGQPLPDRHGYPVRALVPGTYGEVNVKWLDRIELTDRAAEGYYERQGWMPYFVNTTSRFDSPVGGQRIPLAGQPVVPLRGVAFAGDRGVSRVEVSPDGGSSWEITTIDYPGTRLTWSLWSHAWRPPTTGSYRLVVRAADGDGNVQTGRMHGAVPAGATGWHTVRVEVE